jgi:adenylyltransferase/sulfurtransferase
VVRQISVQELAARLSNGTVYLVDVRQPWEHDIAALPGSVLIPLNELLPRASELLPPKGTLTVVYCHHGIRSLQAAALLQHAGIPDVASLAGGIDAWSMQVDATVPHY